MKIGVIQASSQAEKNDILYNITKEAACGHEVINFGCFADEKDTYSYIEIALEAGLLLSSGAVNFIVTGCSSGQGMMLACNNMPDVICGYAPTPQDAFLFGRINDGNAISVPLGLNYGWAGELNLRYTLSALFEKPFGTGYPEDDALRKMQDTKLLKTIKKQSHINMLRLLDTLDKDIIRKALQRRNVVDFITQNGGQQDIINRIKKDR